MRVVTDAHASAAVARALAAFVERLARLEREVGADGRDGGAGETGVASGTGVAGGAGGNAIPSRGDIPPDAILLGGETSPRQVTKSSDDRNIAVLRDALRQLTATSRESGATVRVVNGTLAIDGVPPRVIRARPAADDALLDALRDTLVAAEVGSVAIREGASPAELLTLCRWLVKRAGTSAAAAATSTSPGTSIDRSTTAADAISTTGPASAGSSRERANRSLLRSWSTLVLPPPSTSGSMDAVVSGSVSTISQNTPVSNEAIVAAFDDAAWDPAAGAEPSHVAAAALGRLASARGDIAVSGAVQEIIEAIDLAEQRTDDATIERLARACVAAMRIVGATGGRLALERAYRRLLYPYPLQALTRRLPVRVDSEPLLSLLSRGGDDAIASIIDHLVTSEDAIARRAYFDAVVAMDIGGSLLVAQLSDERWFVVRNAASLLGEMGVEGADVALIALLAHADDRIRIAAGRALLRLRTQKALDALHRMVDDGHAELRRLGAVAYGLAGTIPGRTRPHAARLSAALDRERDDDIALEMLAALGRLGSSDAVQRLLRIALPPAQDITSGERAPPRESWMRVSALEALVRARGKAVAPAIESLLADIDPDVAAAATRLYAGM